MVDFGGIAALARSVVASAGAPDSPDWLDAWPAPGPLRTIAPATLPVLRWLPEATAAAPEGPIAALARSLAAATGAFAWRQTYGHDQAAAAFLERYGWCELIGRSGPVPSDRLACGFLLLGPATLYPRHHHAALELYVPLSGAAAWERGDAGYSVRSPGEAIVHGAGVPHAMRTGDAPLLALYVWRGPGLGEPAQLDS